MQQFDYNVLSLRTNVSNRELDDPCAVIQVDFEIQNVGHMAGDEVVQLYVEQFVKSVPVPIIRLADFERVENVQVQEKRNVTLYLTPRYRSVVYDQDKEPFHTPNIMIEGSDVHGGGITLSVGGGLPGSGVIATSIRVLKSAPLSSCANQD